MPPPPILDDPALMVNGDHKAPSRRGPGLRELGLLLAALVCGSAGWWLANQEPASSRELVSEPREYWKFRPRGTMEPAGLQVPPLGEDAAAGDRALLRGEFEEALEHYATLPAPAIYEPFLRACLLMEQGDLEQARVLCEDLLERGSMIRVIHILDEFLEVLDHSPRSWEEGYLEAVARVATSSKVNLPAKLDPLQDLLESRLLRRPAPIRSDFSLLMKVMARGNLDEARELQQQAATVGELLTALTVLRQSNDPFDQDMIRESLRILQSEEPDNGYPDLLLGTLESGMGTQPGDAPWPEPPPEALESWARFLRKPHFDAHLATVAAELRDGYAQRGFPFPAHWVQEGRSLFLGNFALPEQLGAWARQSAGTLDASSWQLLAQTALHALRMRSPVSGNPWEHDLTPVAEWGQQLANAGRQHGQDVAALEASLPTLSAPSPTAPGKSLERYFRFPLPIPRLHRGYAARYQCRTEDFLRDLTRVWPSRPPR